MSGGIKKALVIVAVLAAAGTLVLNMFNFGNKVEKLNNAIRSEDTKQIDKMLSGLTAEDIDSGAGGKVYHPLVLACEKGQTDTVAKLLDKNVNVNYRTDRIGNTPLTAALGSDSPERYGIAQMLIDHGADLNSVDNYGSSAVTLVLDRKGNDTADTDTAKLDMFRYLCENAAVNACLKAADEENLLVMAADRDCPDAVDWLISTGQFTYSDLPADGGSILHHMYNLDEYGHLTRRPEMVSYVVSKGLEDINSTNADGKTVLIIAAEADEAEDCKAFLALGADKSIRDSKGSSAYDYAVSSGDDELAGMLR